MKHARLAVAALLFFFGLAASSRAQDQSTQYYTAGNSMYSQKNYDMAIRYYQGAVQTNPQMWQAYQGMGNCFYAKGDKQNALTSYQKALSINSNNPQLSSFVQSLQAQVGTAPQSPANNGTAGPAGQTVGASAKNFELEIGAGAGLASNVSAQGYGTDFGFGFGGRGRGLFLIEPNFGIGGTLGFYTFSKSYPGSTISFNYSFIDFAATAKYKFEAGNIKPYAVAGLGISSVSAGISDNSIPSASQTGPLIQIGGGVEVPAGTDMSFFGEVKYEMVLISDNGANLTFSYIPLEAGLAFNL